MSNYHVLKGDKDGKSYGVAFHIPIPSVLNRVGVNYRTAIAQGEDHTSQVPWIEANEQTQLDNGELVEVVESFKTHPNANITEDRDRLDARFNEEEAIMKKLFLFLGCLLFAGFVHAATITATWTENQTLDSGSTITAGSSDTNDIDLDTAGYDCVVVVSSVTFGGTPDDNITVEVFGSVDSGTLEDTIAFTSFSISETASTSKVKSICVCGYPYIAVKVTNNDSTDSITYEGLYAGRKWDSQ